MDLIKHKFLLHSFVVCSLLCEEPLCVLICYSLLAVVTRLQVERYGVRVPADDTYVSLPQNYQTVAGAHQASFSMNRLQDSIPGVKRKVREAIHLRSEPRSRVGGAIPLLPLYALVA